MILTEKYINPTFVDEKGMLIWIDKYGEFVKKCHPDGKLHSCKTEITFETLEDFRNFDAEQELTAILSEEIAREIDQEILNMFLIHGAIEEREINGAQRLVVPRTQV